MPTNVRLVKAMVLPVVNTLHFQCKKHGLDGEIMETVGDFILGAPKSLQMVTAEIKGYLLLGRKAMTNLDSILKSRDITLPAKVHLVKAMVFPVVIYGCESWTINKAEC